MNKRRVAIIYLGNTKKEFPFRPQFEFIPSPGLHYIHAYLQKAGHTSTIISQPSENLTDNEIVNSIKKFDPEIILFNQFFTTRDKIKIIISQLSDKYIIGIGNHDATFHSQSLDENNFNEFYSHADFVWQGEIENNFSDFISTINKKNYPLRINNINHRLQNLDDLPILLHNEYENEIGFIVTSRGCMAKGCDFCTTPQFYPDGWRGRSVNHVKSELENLKLFNKKLIMICDDNFLGFSDTDLDRGAKIISICKQLSLKCSIMTTVNQILNAELKGYLKDFSGTVINVYLGVENGDSNVLKLIGKKCNTRKYPGLASRAISALCKYHIYPSLGYVNFNPESTAEELYNSAKFLFHNNQLATIFYYFKKKLEFYEGTLLHKNYIDHNISIKYFKNDSANLSYSLLQYVTNLTDKLDFLDFEISIIHSLNHSKNINIFHEASIIKNKISNTNYNFFKEVIEAGLNSSTIPSFLESISFYKNCIKKFISQYLIILNQLIYTNDCQIINKDQLIQTVFLLDSEIKAN